MLPPSPTTVLESNPHFSTLYIYLTKNLLASDGSTLSKADSCTEVHKQLDNARQNATKEQLLLRALKDLSTWTPESSITGDVNNNSEESAQPSTEFRSQSSKATPRGRRPPIPSTYLRPDLRELIENISCYLSTSLDPDVAQTLPSDTDNLMADEVSTFRTHLPHISAALNTYLTTLHGTLSNTASTLLPLSPSPAPTLSQTQIQTPSPSSAVLLPPTLSSLLSTLHTSHTTHISTLHKTISHLETHTHGSQARHQSARAAYLASVARGIELKARILRLEREREMGGDSEVMQGLEREFDVVRREAARVDERETALRERMAEYEVAGAGWGRGKEGELGDGDMYDEDEDEGVGRGEEAFRALGKRLRDVRAEIEEVKKDIEKMETRVWRGR